MSGTLLWTLVVHWPCKGTALVIGHVWGITVDYTSPLTLQWCVLGHRSWLGITVDCSSPLAMQGCCLGHRSCLGISLFYTWWPLLITDQAWNHVGVGTLQKKPDLLVNPQSAFLIFSRLTAYCEPLRDSPKFWFNKGSLHKFLHCGYLKGVSCRGFHVKKNQCSELCSCLTEKHF